MKKYLPLIFIMISFIILYSSCNKSKTYYEDILNKNIDRISFDEVVKDDITLPKTFEEEGKISWSSSNPAIISNDGKVILPDKQSVVTLTAIFTYMECSKTIKYDLTVPSKEEVYLPIIEQKIEGLAFESSLKDQDKLPEEFNTVQIVWHSNEVEINNNIISIDQNKDYHKGINIEALFTYNGVSVTKIYHVSIINDYQSVLDTIVNFENTLSFSNRVDGLTHEMDGVTINWDFEPSGIVNDDGTFNKTDVIQNVTLRVNFEKGKAKVTKTYDIVIESLTDEDYVRRVVEKVTLPDEVTENLNLVNKVDNVTITWSSKTISYVNDKGEIQRGEKNRNAILEATFTLNNYVLKKTYQFVIAKYTDLEMINLAINEVKIPTQTNIDLNLPLYFEYDVVASWSSSDETIITNDGKILPQENDVDVILKAVFSKGDESMEKEYNVVVLGKIDPLKSKPHQVIVRSTEFDETKFNGVYIKDGLLELNSTQIEGSYESSMIETMDFNGLVASWASTSSISSTAELMLKVKVGEIWSDYITYHPWGFGLENKCYDQTNSLIKLTEDEVSVLNGKLGCAIIFKIILRRTSIMDESPKFSLASFALKSTSYQYPVDISSLPHERVYDVPRLYQQVVPGIGNSICSPTTSTMLLKYKGEDFSSFDQYEHRYIANKFKEYNTGIFGNWVYNTVGISSFGYNAYVARMYSINELVWHLANVGPVGLSVKGQMTSDKKNYYTNGHLIVGIGYKYIDDVLYIVCNDPNVESVYCLYSIDVMQRTWRNIAYIVE